MFPNLEKSVRCFVILWGVFFPIFTLSAANVFYDFEDDSGVSTDVGGEGIDLPYMGASSQTRDEAKFGKGSLALGEDALMGIGDFIRSNSSSIELAKGISRMTVSVWMRPRSDDMGSKEIFMLQRLNGSEGKGGFTFQYSPAGDAGGRLCFFTSRSDDQEGISRVYSEETFHLLQGEWTHVAMTFENGQISFYVNGQPLGFPQTLPDGGTVIPDITDSEVGVFRIMVSSPSIQYVDDFGFFSDRVLNPEEIQKLYENGLKEFVSFTK